MTFPVIPVGPQVRGQRPLQSVETGNQPCCERGSWEVALSGVSRLLRLLCGLLRSAS